MDARAVPERGDFRSGGLALLDRKQVGFVHQHHRRRAAATDEHKVALHPADVKIRAGVGDDGDDVDVRADDLRLAAVTRHFPGKTSAPGQRRTDDGRLVFIAQLDQHPVTDGGQVGIARRLVPDATAENDVNFISSFDERTVVNHRLTDQPRRNPAFPRESSGGLFQIVVPSKFFQSHLPGNRSATRAAVDSHLFRLSRES